MLIVFGLTYLTDWYEKKANQSYLRFEGEKTKVEKLEINLDNEAKNWPVYARPVLFTRVDKDVQNHFAKARQALTKAQLIKNEIYHPPRRTHSGLKLFSPTKNIECIQACRKLIQMESELRESFIESEQAMQCISSLHHEEERIQEKVKRGIKTLKDRLLKAKSKAEFIDRDSSFNQRIGWVLDYAEIGSLAADQRITAYEDKDLIHFAIANTFIRLTNYLLDHFDLSQKEVSIPTNFLLDHFKERLNDFETQLRQTVELNQEEPDYSTHDEILTTREALVSKEPSPNLITQVQTKVELDQHKKRRDYIETWEDAYAFESKLETLNTKLKRVRSSFKLFLNKKDCLLELDQEISKINLLTLIEENRELERECKKYWKAYKSDPKFWKEALGKLSLPSVYLCRATELFKSYILPFKEPEAKIKQSEMTIMIGKRNSFLLNVERANQSANSLDTLLKKHKKAEVDVNHRLKPKGSTSRVIQKLEEIRADTSDQNQQWCDSYRQEFDVFLIRAKKITNADFPSMLHELDVFEEKCRKLISKHRDEITELKLQCQRSIQNLHQVNSDIVKLKSKTPRDDYDVTGIRKTVARIIQKESDIRSNYNWLQAYLKEARAISIDAEQVLDQLKKRRREFELVIENAKSRLQVWHADLADRQKNVFNSWRWAQIAYNEVLEVAEKKKRAFIQRINLVEQSDALIQDAIRDCQAIMDSFKETEVEITNKLIEIQEQEKQFSDQKRALVRTLGRPRIYRIFNAKPKVPEKVKELCELSVDSESAEEVRLLLEAADDFIKRSITEEKVDQIIEKFEYYEGGVHINDSRFNGNYQVTGRDKYDISY